jgi:hypothetical protein
MIVFFSFLLVNATDKEVQLAEERLPIISNTCTPVSFIVDKDAVTTSTHMPLTVSSRGNGEVSTTQGQHNSVPTDPPSSVSSSRGSSSDPTSSSQGQQITTNPLSPDSESAIGSSTTEGGTQDDSFFLALSLTEFILVTVVVAVVVISACVIIMIALCCCMYVQHMTHCRGN